MSQQLLLITGVFRSGTTLLTKLLNGQQDCLLATDAFLYFFKCFRSRIHREQNGEFRQDQAPIGDDFLPRDMNTVRALRRATLDLDLTEQDRDALKGIDETTARLHPDLAAPLRDIREDTFAAHLRAMLRLLERTYRPDRRPRLLGFKMSWLEPFIPALARSFPEMKFIIPCRDVRAVCASQNAKPEKRSLLFYARQWRRSVACQHAYGSLDAELRNRLRPLRYESLVRRPEPTLRELCSFLELDFNPEMLRVDRRPDETGGSWQANTSFEPRQGIFTSSLERWKTELRPEQAAFLEWLCEPELRLQGYETSGRAPNLDQWLCSPPEVPAHELVAWLRDSPHSDHLRDPGSHLTEMARELLRRRVLDSQTAAEAWSGEVLDRLFVFREYYPTLRRAWQNAPHSGNEPDGGPA
jgi:hypothetical protein